VTNVFGRLCFGLNGVNVHRSAVLFREASLRHAEMKKLIADKIRDWPIRFIPGLVRSWNSHHILAFRHFQPPNSNQGTSSSGRMGPDNRSKKVSD